MTGELHEGSKWQGDCVIDADGQAVSMEGALNGSRCLSVSSGDSDGEWAYAEDAHAVLERGGCCPHASGPRLTDEEFRALMALMMVEDSLTVLTEEKAILVRLMNAEAKIRGYSDWIAAYHADWKSKGFAGAEMCIVDAMFPAKVAEPNEIRAIVAELESKNPAEVALAEVRVAVAQLLELRLGEMSAKESELLDVIRERAK